MNRIHNLDPSDLIARCLKLEEMAVLQRPEIQSALMFMAGNLDREMSVKQIAERQRVSRRTLELRFRTFLNCTVGKMLTRLRVIAACRLLMETELSAHDISVDAGFASASSMANALRRHLGKSATEIRSQQASREPSGPGPFRQPPDSNDSD